MWTPPALYTSEGIWAGFYHSRVDRFQPKMVCVLLSFPQQFQTGVHCVSPSGARGVVPSAVSSSLGEAALGMLQGYPHPGSTALPSSYFRSSILAGLGPAGPAGPSGISAGISAERSAPTLPCQFPGIAHGGEMQAPKTVPYKREVLAHRAISLH